MIEEVIRIVKEAAAFMKERSFAVENKGLIGNDVTSADKAVQEYIKNGLLALDETIGFVGEEEMEPQNSDDTDSDASQKQNPRAWVVDPIDGTANFIRGMNASVISVGLVDNDEAVLGVVYNPYQDELFQAEKGKGAFLNGRRIHVSDRDFRHGIYCTAFCLYWREYAKLCQDIMSDVYEQCEDFRRVGTAALELTHLAAGRVELYFEIQLYPWDYAASVVIVREAGGYIGTIGDEKRLYHSPSPIIAANSRENYEKLKAIVTKRYTIERQAQI